MAIKNVIFYKIVYFRYIVQKVCKNELDKKVAIQIFEILTAFTIFRFYYESHFYLYEVNYHPPLRPFRQFLSLLF